MVGVPGLLSSELTDIMGTDVGVETCTMSPVNGGLKEAEVAGGTWKGGRLGMYGEVVGGVARFKERGTVNCRRWIGNDNGGTEGVMYTTTGKTGYLKV